MTESQVLIDALPYTDEGYEDEKVRESAARLIEEEVLFSLGEIIDFHSYNIVLK